MQGLFSWFVVQLMPDFSLIDGVLTYWGLLDVHSPERGPIKPPSVAGGLASPTGASYTCRGDGWAPLACGSLAGWSCDVTSLEGGVLISCSFRSLSDVSWVRQ